jgi:hypothetical protein
MRKLKSWFTHGNHIDKPEIKLHGIYHPVFGGGEL